MKVNVQCGHGYLLHVPLNRVQVVDGRLHLDDGVCEAHLQTPSRFKQWREVRKLRREMRRLNDDGQGQFYSTGY